MQITRRDAFLGTAAAVAVAAVPTVAQAATGPTEVERLYADLLRARAIHSQAGDACERAYQEAKALFSEPPFPETKSGPTAKTKLYRLLDNPLVDHTLVRQKLKKWDAYDEECNRIQDACGAVALETRNNETYDQIMEIQNALLDVPSVTIRDVLLKLLSVWREDIWEQEIDYHGLNAPVAVAVKRDLERLAGETGA